MTYLQWAGILLFAGGIAGGILLDRLRNWACDKRRRCCRCRHWSLDGGGNAACSRRFETDPTNGGRNCRRFSERWKRASTAG